MRYQYYVKPHLVSSLGGIADCEQPPPISPATLSVPAVSYRRMLPPHPHRGASGTPHEMGRRRPGGVASFRKSIRQIHSS